MKIKKGYKSNVVLVILDANAFVSLVHDGLLDVQEFDKVIITDVVEFEIARKADADVDAFMKANKDRIEIRPTSFRDLLEAARKNNNIATALPPDMCLLSTYSLVNKILHEEPLAVILISDEFFEKNTVRQSFVRLMTLHEFRDVKQQ